MKNIKHLHALSINNHDLIQLAGSAVCFSCYENVDYIDIYDYLDKNETAVCPKCDLDTLIPKLTPALVEEVHAYAWATTEEETEDDD